MKWVQPNGSRGLGFCCLGFLAAVACAFGQFSPGPTPPSTQSSESHERIASRLFTLSRLGPEHVANAVYRRGADRNSYIVAWGDRILQWPLERNGAVQKVYPQEGDWQYINGGCACDVDQDGVDEIVTGRGHGGSQTQHELVWLDEVEGRDQFRMHTFARLDIVGWAAPHDIQPLEVQVGDERVRGVVYNISRHHLYFAEIPRDPKAEWPVHAIGRFPGDPQLPVAMAS